MTHDIPEGLADSFQETTFVSLAKGLRAFYFEGILILEFNETKSRNAVSFGWSVALARIADHFSAQNPAPGFAATTGPIGCLVLVSALPDVFVSGGDLREILEMPDPTAFTSHMRRFTRFLSSAPFPTVALLEGGAYGGGAEIALACDDRVWPTDSKKSSPALNLWQAKWGVPGGWGGMGRLEDLCPMLGRRAVSLLFARSATLDREELLQLRLLRSLHEREAGSQRSPSPTDMRSRLPGPLKALFSVGTFEFLREQAQAFLSFPENLRTDLLSRQFVPSAQREKFDEEIFAKHWLGDEHKSRLTTFLEKKNWPCS